MTAVPPEAADPRVRKAMRVVLAIVAIAGIVLGGAVVRQRSELAYRIEYRALRARFEAAERTPPPAIGQEAWAEVWEWNDTALANATSPSRDYGDGFAAMRRDIEAKMDAGPLTLETAEWVWWRIGQLDRDAAEATPLSADDGPSGDGTP